MIKLSAVIITYNEERNITRCINAVKGIADEIIVVDSTSTDNTVSIAKQLGAKVVDQPFLGYLGQRNFGDNTASHNWILMLDADEEISASLAQQILRVKEKTEYNAYRFPRLNNYCGKWIRHGAWYPDKKTRLYDRTKGSWHGGMVHEYWKPNAPGDPIGNLEGDMLHYSFATMDDRLQKIEKYSELAALTAIKNGRTASLFKIWASPKWRFFSEYILQRGFMDGFEGYMIAKLSAYEAFIKYAKIRQYSRQKKAINGTGQ